MTPELCSLLAAVAPTYDTELPSASEDGTTPYVLTEPVIVVSEISHTPQAIDISGPVALSSQRITCEIQSTDLASARTLRTALKSALHGWKGGTIKYCAWEMDGPTLFDLDTIPPRYVLPVDFMLTY